MSHRLRQVNALLQKIVGEILSREVELPSGVFVTIIKVETLADLKEAVVSVTVLPDNQRELVIKQLQKLQKSVRYLVGKKIKFKFTPQIRFALDEGAIKAHRINDLLDSN